MKILLFFFLLFQNFFAMILPSSTLLYWIIWPKLESKNMIIIYHKKVTKMGLEAHAWWGEGRGGEGFGLVEGHILLVILWGPLEWPHIFPICLAPSSTLPRYIIHLPTLHLCPPHLLFSLIGVSLLFSYKNIHSNHYYT